MKIWVWLHIRWSLGTITFQHSNSNCCQCEHLFVISLCSLRWEWCLSKVEIKVKIKVLFSDNHIMDDQICLRLNMQSQFSNATQPKTTSIFNWWLWVRKCNNTRFPSLVSVSYFLWISALQPKTISKCMPSSGHIKYVISNKQSFLFGKLSFKAVVLNWFYFWIFSLDIK